MKAIQRFKDGVSNLTGKNKQPSGKTQGTPFLKIHAGIGGSNGTLTVAVSGQGIKERNFDSPERFQVKEGDEITLRVVRVKEEKRDSGE